MGLKKYFGIIFIILLFWNCTNQQHDIVFEDFESSTFDKWEIQGTSFDKPYLADTINNNILKNSISGHYFAYSYINDTVLNQGKLISPIFKIKHKYIDFLIGGGDFETRTCINLFIDNKIVRTTTGQNKNALSKKSWDVSEYIGKKAIIEIVDAKHWPELGYIMVDDIIFSNHQPQPTIIFEDFESGTFEHWQVKGNAFQNPGNRSNIYYPVTVNGFQGKYFAFSFGENHDKETGRLISEPFIINRNFISFLVGGGNHPETTCIQLIINDSVKFSSTGLNTGELRKEFWDVSELLGQKAHIEILDKYSKRWGHIIIDDIRFTDVLDNSATTIYYHKSNRGITYGVSIFVIICFCVFMFIRFRKKKPPVTKPHEVHKDLKKQILKLLESEHIYLTGDLSASEVAENLGISTNELLKQSEIIFKKSFIDLINEYRVNHFKQEVLKPENKELKLVAIAEKCGFTSKSSFYRIFKKHTNQTPTDYLQENKE